MSEALLLSSDFQPKVGLVYAVFVLVVDAAAGVVQTRLELVGVQQRLMAHPPSCQCMAAGRRCRVEVVCPPAQCGHACWRRPTVSSRV